MELENILKKLPSIISNSYESIYLLDKNNNNLYILNYKGNLVEVVKKTSYNEINNYLDSSIISYIESNSNIKKVFNNKFIISNDVDNYKLIFVINIDVKKESNSKYSLLVADDSVIITNFFKKIFEDKFNILVAKNGDEAIKLVEENKNNNLIGCFIDLKMPIRDGYYVLNYFKDNNLFKLIPVSVISGEDDGEVISKITDSYQIVDMLTKPFDRESAESIVSKTIALSPIYKN